MLLASLLLQRQVHRRRLSLDLAQLQVLVPTTGRCVEEHADKCKKMIMRLRIFTGMMILMVMIMIMMVLLMVMMMMMMVMMMTVMMMRMMLMRRGRRRPRC